MTEMIVNYHFLEVGKPYKYHDKRRSEFQKIYADFLAAEPALGKHVLDIGCGHGINPTLDLLRGRLGELDGVDPFPMVAPPPHLKNIWTMRLEDLAVSENTYDMAYSYNVVEHVENVDSFLKKTVELLKPGGFYWSMSPNARHPFTSVTRLAQAIRLKSYYQKNLNRRANDYPAYYRLSDDRRILRTIRKKALPISRVDFYYLPNVQWDHYFPVALRWIPHALDRLLLLRRPKMSFIFMFRIQKAETQ